MTKHRKHKTNKRRQRGGWGFDLFGKSDTNTNYTTEVSNYTTKASEEANKLGARASEYATEASSAITGLFNSAKKSVTGETDTYTAPVTTGPPVTTQYKPPVTPVNASPLGEQIDRPINASPPIRETIERRRGGKRYRKSFKGGKGGLGLAYYATPVSGLKVVEPNEWLFYNNMANLKGGSRRRKCKTRKRNCKTRRRKCKTRRRK
jgi:hypothetical protein